MNGEPEARGGWVVATIGVHGHTDVSFLQSLLDAKVDVLCDVRLRRVMRVPALRFANAQRLQRLLKEHGIAYCHEKGLAPTMQLRQIQRLHDKKVRKGKRRRMVLCDEFVCGFRAETLSQFSWAGFIHSLPIAPGTIAFMCVEKEASACHRSLVASGLATNLGCVVRNL